MKPLSLSRSFATACLLLLVAFAVFAFTFATGAQELPIATPVAVDQVVLAPTPPPAAQLPANALLITLLVPVVIAALKRAFPKLPAASLPVIAPVLGALLEYGLTRLGVSAGGTVAGAVAGSAGVGAREIVHQARKAAEEMDGSYPPMAALLLFLVPVLCLTPGCAGFSNRQQDRSVVIHPDGTREERDITSRQRASTLLDSKSALAQLKAQQTDKTQTIGIGSLNQESTAPQVGQMLGLDILAKVATSPEGQKLILRALGVPIP